MELNVDWDEKYKQRFLDSFVKGDCEDSCWIWNGRVLFGYPRFWNGKSLINVRKLVYEQFYKVKLSKKKHLYNVCNNKLCINFLHLSDKEPIELTIKRFFKYVKKNNHNDCFSWSGYKDKNGYGILRIDDKKIRAHRFSFEFHNNFKIPKGLCCCHKCDNTECTNVFHMFIGTIFDNNKDKTDKGRQPKGEKNGRSKLKEYQVREILKSNEKNSTIAKHYDVSIFTIKDIKARKTWKHISDE